MQKYLRISGAICGLIAIFATLLAEKEIPTQKVLVLIAVFFTAFGLSCQGFAYKARPASEFWVFFAGCDQKDQKYTFVLTFVFTLVITGLVFCLPYMDQLNGSRILSNEPYYFLVLPVLVGCAFLIPWSVSGWPHYRPKLRGQRTQV